MENTKRIFSISQKPQELVNAEDLETLQNELEDCLVEVVTQKWELEQECLALSSTSPDLVTASQPVTSATNTSSSHNGSNLVGGKLRSSLRSHLSETPENHLNDNDLLFSNNLIACNSNEDSVSSESSLVSSLTSSTIITNTLSEAGPLSASADLSTQIKAKRSHRGSNDRPSKRFRQNSNNSLTSSASGYSKRPSLSKHRSKLVPSKFRQSNEKSQPDKKQPLKNSAPDKLWPFIDQFCAAPTSEQLKDLEDMIQAIEQDRDYFKIPALGKKEALTKDNAVKQELTPNKSNKKPKAKCMDEEPGLGALTQRLVSSFIVDTDDLSNEDSAHFEVAQHPKKKNSNKVKGGKGIDMNSAKCLERRIRQELEEYDILDQKDEIPYTSEEDEILRELVANQHELLSIQRENKESMLRLLKKAKRHIEIEEERQKLGEANADVVGAYHKLIVAKQRKRNPTKKEKDAALKALKIQEVIFKKCDDLYLESVGQD